jgi:DNA mismatch endonuclease (patch repair protein)
MARIKGCNTSPEKTVRRCLRKVGVRFSGHVEGLPGTPDIIIQEQRKAIFVHGCFWHGHKGCRRSERPETNRPFWDKKIDGNIARDSRNLRDLKKEGWKVLVIWQCQIKDESRLMNRLLRFAEK